MLQTLTGSQTELFCPARVLCAAHQALIGKRERSRANATGEGESGL
jgi:hypothetical protein